MINLNVNIFNYITLLADIPESYSLYGYLKSENKMFMDAESVKDSPVKNIDDLTKFTVLRVVLEDVYKYWVKYENEIDFEEMGLNKEKIKENGLFMCIKKTMRKIRILIFII
ncbi:MAG: hypothetical protein HDT42_07500 [Ruminococcaceae bacterium]|nr:hypothetical protein [Oscillospiraceae bacterium]